VNGQYTSEAQRSYCLLRDRILAGDFAEGAVLNQLEIAQDLGTSRTPVREAMARLAADGLVTDIAGRGARVTTLSVRWLLESFAARVAADHMPAAVIDEYRTRIVELEAGPADPAGVEALDQELHQAIALHSGNARMREFIGQLNGIMTIARRRDVAETPDGMLASLKELIDALHTRNADLAERLMREHIGSFTSRLPGLVVAALAPTRGRR
jgi:DNA-binding GntR family transcriptional regulator